MHQRRYITKWYCHNESWKCENRSGKIQLYQHSIDDEIGDDDGTGDGDDGNDGENNDEEDDLYRGRQHEQLDGDWAKWRKCVRSLPL